MWQREQAYYPQQPIHHFPTSWCVTEETEWRYAAVLSSIGRNQQHCHVAKGKLLSRSLRGEALIIHAGQNIKNLGIALTSTCQQPSTRPTTGWFCGKRLSLPLLWVSVIYAHVYWCLSHGLAHCLLSSTISSQMNHQWTNWGTSLRICRIYGGYASLQTSPLASKWNEEKTDGARSWHVWRLKHLGFMVLFMLFCTFALHLVQTSCQDPCYLSAC